MKSPIQRLADGCVELAMGLAACAKHARDPRTVEAARPLADELRALSRQLGPLRAIAPRTSERMRWEWLASTGALLDGTPDARLVAECARLAARAQRDARAAELAAEGARDEAVRRAAHAIVDAHERARLGRVDA